MPKKLLFASRNISKIREYSQMLQTEGIEVITLNDLEITDNVEEDEPTLEANALKKAMFYHKKSGLPTLADDAAFEIDYLGGLPGVKSRRPMGYEATDEQLVDWLKKQVAKIPPDQRTCRFRAVSCLVKSESEFYKVGHAKEGYLTDEIRDDYNPGFPYRSMFIEKETGQYLMDLTPKEYENLNHRKKNIFEIIKYL